VIAVRLMAAIWVRDQNVSGRSFHLPTCAAILFFIGLSHILSWKLMRVVMTLPWCVMYQVPWAMRAADGIRDKQPSFPVITRPRPGSPVACNDVAGKYLERPDSVLFALLNFELYGG